MRRVLGLIDYFLDGDARRLVALKQPAGRFNEAKYREQVKGKRSRFPHLLARFCRREPRRHRKGK